MSTAVEKEEKGIYYLIRIIGDFSVKSIRAIRDCIDEADSIGHIYIALDLQKTAFIDSSGIGLIMNLHKKLMARQGSLYLIGIPAVIKETFRVSGILQLIPVFETLEQADQQIG